MSQIQVTGEAKIRDLQGPVVANSGVITALDGLPSQYVRGDGTLADIPSVTGGGASVSYYLNGSVNQGTFGGFTYYQLGENAITGVGTNFSTSTDGLLAQFITDAGVPDQTEIPSGNWNIEFFMGVSASSGALASFYVEIYKYDGTTFTLVGSNVTTPEFLTNTTTVDAYFTSVAMPFTVLAQTDRIAIRVYASVAGKTVTMYTEDNRLCQVVTTFSRGMLSLNSLTDQQQYLTVGTAGTDFNIVSSVDTHTFNIPSASATNRGLITTGTQTIAGVKTFLSSTIQEGLSVLKNDAFQVIPSGYTALTGYGLGGLTILQGDGTNVYNTDLDFPNTSNRQYTFPDLSGTIALLEGTQTFTGDKTFDGITNFDSAVLFNALQNQFSNGLQIAKTNTILRNTGYMTISANAGTGSSIKFSDGNSTYDTLFNFDNTANRSYTFPALSGTVALTSNIPTVSGASGQVTYFNGTSSVTGSNNFFWDATNNRLGIGLTNPQRALEIYSATADSHLRLSGSAPSVSLGEAITGSIYQAKFGLATAAGQYVSGAVAGDFVMLSQTGATIFATSATEKMRLTSGGLLLLGTTSSTGELLQVAGTAKFAGALSGTSATFSDKVNINADQGAFRLYNTAASFVGGIGNGAWVEGATLTNVALYSVGDLKFYTGGSSTNKLTIASTGAATFSSTLTSDAITIKDGGNNGQGTLNLGSANNYKIQGGADYLGINFYTNGGLRMFINSTGNVGIGTSSPSQKLEIANTSGTVYTRLTADFGSGFIGMETSDDSMRILTAQATPIQFYTDNAERMRITSGGTVYIGATSVPFPGFLLNVIGNPTTTIPLSRYYVNGANTLSIPAIRLDKFDNNTSTSQVFIDFTINAQNNASGSITANGANQATFTSWSDKRLKENITDLPSQLSNIMSLRPVEFDYKDGSGHQIGFIAQEIQEVYPDIVGENADGYLTISGLGKMESRLIKAIQEQQEQIEELSNKIVALELK